VRKPLPDETEALSPFQYLSTLTLLKGGTGSEHQ
jgi:hypothetical protein